MYEAEGGGDASNRKIQNNFKRFTHSHIEAALIYCITPKYTISRAACLITRFFGLSF